MSPERRPTSSPLRVTAVGLLVVGLVAAVVAGLLVLLSAVLPGPTIPRQGPAQLPDEAAITDGSVPVTWSTSPVQPDTTGQVSGVITDLETFWGSVLPSTFDAMVTPMTGGVVAIDPSATAFTGEPPGCVTTPSRIAGNAYFCPDRDKILYDAGGLVPVLLGHYGPAGLVAAFAHEYGHAIQARIGPTPADRSAEPARWPALLVELQADCDAGVFLRAATIGRTAHVALLEADLPAAVGPLLDFADAPDVPPGDAAAHGLSLDRLRAVLAGYAGDAATCHDLTLDALRPTLGLAGAVQPVDTPRYADTAAVLSAARSSLRAFSNADLPADISPTAEDLAAAAPYGQFAEAAALALALGRVTDPDHPTCVVGAWTASVLGAVPPGTLGSWATDADEALAFLRARPGVTWADLQDYARGFDGGCP
ncbi:hypothetical protein GIS00_22530 [Nakamurella sp. YIM 132087]|uniref:Peptidase n=1 Tax=Nakamurella alba TaxID=2665158 RepID=A0A7K1FRE5_9ACTN|nr:hypothetical protein [Nakamurella alba]MTD16717.1 hypothetical protein [Nakamurella alba]